MSASISNRSTAMSSDYAFIAYLVQIQTNFYRIGGPILMVIGTLSCILSFMVFMRKNLRKNPCSIMSDRCQRFEHLTYLHLHLTFYTSNWIQNRSKLIQSSFLSFPVLCDVSFRYTRSILFNSGRHRSSFTHLTQRSNKTT